MSNNITESATQSVALITKEQCQQMSDTELLELVQCSQGHTKDFQTYMNCDFSYTYLTGLLKERGYENGWYRSSDIQTSKSIPTVIQMKKSSDTVVRQSYMIDKSTAEEWKKFNQNVPYKTVTLGCALNRFMNDVKSGRIKFELEI